MKKLAAEIIWTTILLVTFIALAMTSVVSLCYHMWDWAIWFAIGAIAALIGGILSMIITFSWARDIDEVIYALVIKAEEDNMRKLSEVFDENKK